MVTCYACKKEVGENNVLYDVDRIPFCSAKCANETYEKWGKLFIKSCPMCGRQIIDNPNIKRV